jgi:glycosyltransferase involved in cell wall biosynthesis
MIRAFVQAREKLEADPVFVIAGRIGYGGDDIRRAIAESGGADHVKLVGYVPDEDVPALYSGARGLLFTTLYEGFGIPAVEAMACGCPVIGGIQGSVPEIVGDAGLLADPTNIEDIATQIRRLFSDQDLHDTLAARGLLRAQDFSWEATARQCLEIYQELS